MMNRIRTLLIAVSLLANTSASSGGRTAGEGFGEPVELRDAHPQDTLGPVQIHGRWGHMNQKGHLVIVPRFDWTDYFNDGLARAVVDGRTGFIRHNGEWFIQPQYVYADRFAEGRAVIGDGTQFGYIEKSGKILVPIRLQGALRFREGRAAVLIHGVCRLMLKNGDPEDRRTRFKFLQIRSSHDNLVMVQMLAGDRRGPLAYIRNSNKALWADDRGLFSDLGDFNDGLAKARVGDRWGYMDKTFKLRIEPRFEGARDFTNGLAAVKRAGKWGYIDKRGTMAIDPQFDSADDFDGDLAMINHGGRFGYINRIGKYEIEPQFEDAEPFFRNYARVFHGPDFGYVDRTGRLVWDPRRTAKAGIVDVRRVETTRIGVAKNTLFHRKLKPPPARATMSSPYPPEHVYEELLPRRK
jgi:hypothetical protein